MMTAGSVVAAAVVSVLVLRVAATSRSMMRPLQSPLPSLLFVVLLPALPPLLRALMRRTPSPQKVV